MICRGGLFFVFEISHEGGVRILPTEFTILCIERALRMELDVDPFDLAIGCITRSLAGTKIFSIVIQCRMTHCSPGVSILVSRRLVGSRDKANRKTRANCRYKQSRNGGKAAFNFSIMLVPPNSHARGRRPWPGQSIECEKVLVFANSCRAARRQIWHSCCQSFGEALTALAG